MLSGRNLCQMPLYVKDAVSCQTFFGISRAANRHSNGKTVGSGLSSGVPSRSTWLGKAYRKKGTCHSAEGDCSSVVTLKEIEVLRRCCSRQSTTTWGKETKG